LSGGRGWGWRIPRAADESCVVCHAWPGSAGQACGLALRVAPRVLVIGQLLRLRLPQLPDLQIDRRFQSLHQPVRRTANLRQPPLRRPLPLRPRRFRRLRQRRAIRRQRPEHLRQVRHLPANRLHQVRQPPRQRRRHIRRQRPRQVPGDSILRRRRRCESHPNSSIRCRCPPFLIAVLLQRATTVPR
jgi:hypothetical protein